MAQLLRHIEVVPIDEELGRRTGVLLAQAEASDPIDASLVLIARDGDRLVTSDPDDLRRLVVASGRRVFVSAC